MRRIALLVLAAATLSWPADLVAQGNGNAYGRAKNARPPLPASAATSAAAPSSAASAEVQASVAGSRQFGSWLDDASVVPAGRGFLSLGISVWRMPGYREIGLPTIDTAVGIHNRVQFGASLPYYHASEPGGPVARGVGNTYLSSKIQLRDPAAGGLGFSVTPMLEVLGFASEGSGRVNWAVPLNLELQRRGWRTYASTGFFSRGAFFASGALERAMSDTVWLTGTISHSYSLREHALSSALGIARARTDVGAGAAVALSPAVAAFGSIGRTISGEDAGSSSLVVAGGLSVAFAVR